jgi:polyphosphate kinase 2 (PPK2 family)
MLSRVSDSARLDAELLLEYVTGLTRTAFRAAPERELPAQAGWAFQQLVMRRLKGEPIAYIRGHQEFWSLLFEVTPAVLVPRPETELVVERALVHLEKRGQKRGQIYFLSPENKSVPFSPKAEFERLLPSVRDQLLAAQNDLQKRKPFGLAVIVTGIPTAGRSEVVNHILEWLDPKHIKVHALEKLRHSSHTRPPLWRYWITLPARGEIAIYFLGWYEDYLRLAEREPKKARRHEARLFARIRQLEAMLVKDKVRVLKLHLQVTQKTAARRLKELRSSKLTRWRITHEDSRT